MLADVFAFVLAADPTALPLWGVILFSASLYPLGLLFAAKGCDRCVRVRCYLDPRGYWEATQFDEELGYALGDERTTKCRKACNNTAPYRLPTYFTDDRDTTIPFPRGCSEFLSNAVPDWEQHFHCQEDSPATQLEVTLSGAVAATAPSGDALETEIQAGFDEFRDAINSTVILDLDCEGYGGCVPLSNPVGTTSVENFFGNRVVRRTQVQPVMTARVDMKKNGGVDASGIFLYVMALNETYYYSNTTPAGAVVEQYDLPPLAAVTQNNLTADGYAGVLGGPFLALTGKNGALGCANAPSAGREVDQAVPPYSGNWNISTSFFHLGVFLDVYAPASPIPEAISTDGCFREPAECSGRTFTRDPYVGGSFSGAPGSSGLYIETLNIGPLLDPTSAITWEASLS